MADTPNFGLPGNFDMGNNDELAKLFKQLFGENGENNFADFLQKIQPLNTSGTENNSISIQIDPEMAQMLFNGDALNDPQVQQLVSTLFSNFGMGELHDIFSPGTSAASSDTMNWALAKKNALQKISTSGQTEPTITAQIGDDCRRALTVADLWVDTATDFSPVNVKAQVWTRASWIENTLDSWKALAEPLGQMASKAINDAREAQLQAQSDSPLAGLLGTGFISRMTSNLYGRQLGQALGTLALSLTSYTDAGFPLSKTAAVALVPANIQKFGQDLGVPDGEILMFWALREIAHARLFAHCPWIYSLIEQYLSEYAKHFEKNLDALQDEMGNSSLEDLGELENALRGQNFNKLISAEQKIACENLENLLALIEGWVQLITLQAGSAHMPHLMAMQEMLQRHLAGSPLNSIFQALIGLRLEPKRVREALKLWQLAHTAWGSKERDDLWAHPDLLPTGADLDDPESFISSRQNLSAVEAELEAGLNALLDGNLGNSDQDHE